MKNRLTTITIMLIIMIFTMIVMPSFVYAYTIDIDSKYEYAKPTECNFNISNFTIEKTKYYICGDTVVAMNKEEIEEKASATCEEGYTSVFVEVKDESELYAAGYTCRKLKTSTGGNGTSDLGTGGIPKCEDIYSGSITENPTLNYYDAVKCVNDGQKCIHPSGKIACFGEGITASDIVCPESTKKYSLGISEDVRYGFYCVTEKEYCYCNPLDEQDCVLTHKPYGDYDYISDMSYCGIEDTTTDGNASGGTPPTSEEPSSVENNSDTGGNVTISGSASKFDYDEICSNTGIIDAVRIIGYFITVAKWIVPLIIIVMGMIDFGKAVLSSEEKALNQATSTLIRRLIAGVIIFCIPDLILAVLDVIKIGGIENTTRFEACTRCILDAPENCPIGENDN